MGVFDGYPINIVLKQGTSTNLALSTTYLMQGEIVYTTDTFQIWTWNGSAKIKLASMTSSGSKTLTVGTTTTVTDAAATTTSVIVLQATSTAFLALTPYISAKGAGSFTITTLAAAGTETFDYLITN